MSAEQIIFYIVAAIAIAGALGVVFSGDIVHAALFLVLALMMTAGVFVLLSAEFLGIVQILIYGGAVSILIVFALMLTRARQLRMRLDGPQKPFGFVAAAVLAVGLILMVTQTTWPGSTSRITVVPFESFSRQLFNAYNVPFELVSLVLLVALVGAVVIARSED
ncbi:MAG: NADH-quinone oxidoreductase subunit J family protein [Dehalococcoidia bacterium]